MSQAAVLAGSAPERARIEAAPDKNLKISHAIHGEDTDLGSNSEP